MAKIKIYSTPTCSWCMRLKDFLDEKNIEFDNIDVSKSHEAAHELMNKSGQMGVPVTDIDGTIIIGFDITPSRFNSPPMTTLKDNPNTAFCAQKN